MNNMRKKWMNVLTVAILSVSITACGSAQKNNSDPTPSATTATNAEPTTGTSNSQNSSPVILYTADEGGSITKIDATTYKVIKSIDIDGSVHNVQISPDGKTVGVTVVPTMGEMEEGAGNEQSEHEMNGYAYFFSTSSDELIQKVEVGAHPAHIVFTNDGKYVLVTNNEGNDVSVIDAKSLKIVNSIPTGTGPHGFRISADSKYAYIANMAEDTVSVLDLDAMNEKQKISVGNTPVTTGITSDGKILVVPLNAENAAGVVDLDSSNITKVPVGNGPAQVYISADNKYAVIANQGTEENPSHSISKIDLGTKQVTATTETGTGAHGVVISPDGSKIFVTNMFDNTVTVIDNETNQVITTINVGTTPNGISITP